MNDLDRPFAQPSRITAAELRKLPPAERDRILEAQTRLAESHYRNDPELTAFETYGEGDLYDLDWRGNPQGSNERGHD